MENDRKYRIQNKSDKPDNIVRYENRVMDECLGLESLFPDWMKDYFVYLKSSVALTTRQAYLRDLLYFYEYLIRETSLTQAQVPKDVTLEEMQRVSARDVNWYMDYLTRYFVESGGQKTVLENHSRSLSRKRSSLSVFFKYHFRAEMFAVNITDGFNPIRLPKPHPDAIKRLEIEEVDKLLNAAMSGEGLTDKERVYWNKTKYRDRAILALFITYGLRLKELQQLNLSSFSAARNEFRIFRKRGKEVRMPINKTCEKVIQEYLDYERPKSSELAEEDRDALFLSLQKTRMTELAIRQLVKKYTSIAMGTSRDFGYSPHKLRATAATSLIEYGFSIFDVQNLMDHDNVTTTQLYAAHRRHAKRDLINQYEVLGDKELPQSGVLGGNEGEKEE